MMMTCRECGERVEEMCMGTVTKKFEADTSYSGPPATYVEKFYGTVNQPCGHIDAGIRFEDAE